MYHANKKSNTNVDDQIIQNDCFIEKNKSWLRITMVLIAGILVYAIIASPQEENIPPANSQSSTQGGQFQNTALTQCPYCPGFLDTQGRCNVRGCSIYSPNWGKLSSPEGIPVKRVLIKELALEIGASQGKASVIIQAVYPGGNAEKAGLQVGDKILRFNGRNVKNVKQFKATVIRAKPEALVKIKILRNNEKIKTTTMIGEGEMEGVTLPKI